MSEWSVEVVRVDDGTMAVDDWWERLDDALKALEELAPVGSIGPDRDRYSLRITIEAEDFGPAMMNARQLIVAACTDAELPDWPVAHVEATEVNELDRVLEESSYPGLLGVAELSELLDVSKQRASELARMPHFPSPVAELKSGPVWDESMVQRFVRDWKRSPGRPKKVSVQSGVADDLVDVITTASEAARRAIAAVRDAPRLEVPDDASSLTTKRSGPRS